MMYNAAMVVYKFVLSKSHMLGTIQFPIHNVLTLTHDLTAVTGEFLPNPSHPIEDVIEDQN